MLLEQRVPSPCKGEGHDCMDAGGRAMHGAIAEDGGELNRSGVYEHPHPYLPPCRGKGCVFISTALILRGEGISPSKVLRQLLSSHSGAL